MGLRDVATRDIRYIHADAAGPQWTVKITDPQGNFAELQCIVTDIALAVDLDTGVQVTGRTAEVNCNLLDLAEQGLGIPEAVEDSSSKPWLMEFDDVLGNVHVFKVSESSPDRTVGECVVLLEVYQ